MKFITSFPSRVWEESGYYIDDKGNRKPQFVSRPATREDTIRRNAFIADYEARVEARNAQ